MKIKKTKIIKANSVCEASKICKWATAFQRTEDYKITGNWICWTYINNKTKQYGNTKTERSLDKNKN